MFRKSFFDAAKAATTLKFKILCNIFTFTKKENGKKKKGRKKKYIIVSMLLYRWDLQRMREQKIYEKLKEKERTAENLKKGEDQSVETFYPLLDESK